MSMSMLVVGVCMKRENHEVSVHMVIPTDYHLTSYFVCLCLSHFSIQVHYVKSSFVWQLSSAFLSKPLSSMCICLPCSLPIFLFPSQEVRPTVFVGVPRVWEKFKEAMEKQLKEASGIKEVIIDKARVSHVIL